MLPFDYVRPGTLDEVTTILLEHGAGARILSGGTDLIVGLRHGMITPGIVVDLKRVVDLPRTIDHDDRLTVVGSGATITDLVADPVVKQRFPALVEAADTVGSIQIRNRATLTGNICNASPAADTGTPLLIYGASVRLLGPNGVREMPLSEFVLGPRRIALEPGEFVIAVVIPAPSERIGTSFARMTRRRGVDLATINLSCAVSESGVTTFGFGAVGPKPFTVVDESGVLASGTASLSEKDPVLRALVDVANPITDVRASREYRLAMLLVMSKRILKTAIDRLQEVS